ncbi:hypothetical protein MTO96_029760 [Rhipicephalus appendiculatus]
MLHFVELLFHTFLKSNRDPSSWLDTVSCSWLQLDVCTSQWSSSGTLPAPEHHDEVANLTLAANPANASQHTPYDVKPADQLSMSLEKSVSLASTVPADAVCKIQSCGKAAARLPRNC